MSVHTEVGPGDKVTIWVDSQHLSRISHAEAKQIICQLLVFGGTEFRNDIKRWLDGGTLDDIGRYIAPEKNPAPVIPPDSLPNGQSSE